MLNRVQRYNKYFKYTTIIILIFVVADETADDDDSRTGNKHVVRPGFNFSDAESGSYGQNDETDD